MILSNVLRFMLDLEMNSDVVCQVFLMLAKYLIIILYFSLPNGFNIQLKTCRLFFSVLYTTLCLLHLLHRLQRANSRLSINGMIGLAYFLSASFIPNGCMKSWIAQYGSMIDLRNEYLVVDGPKTKWPTGTRIAFISDLKQSIHPQ